MKILTFGEILLRLKPPGLERFFQSPIMEASFGGGEANVAVSLANFGMDVQYCTVLPNNVIGDECIKELRQFGVDVSKVKRGEGRMGIYFLESGANQLPSKVTYDRSGSSIAIAQPELFNWNEIFDGIDWYHITGITPALSETAMELSLASVKAAKEKGITVSCDLNFRKNLWKYGKKASEVMRELASYVDIAIANEEDVQKSLEITVDIRLVSATNENLEQAIEKGTFREDLYHRINEFTLRMPTLKERREDILLFANFFLDQANKELDKQLIGFDAKASQALLDYHWPGNLRQMKNIVKRATLLAQGSLITPMELGTEILETPISYHSSNIALKDEETEKQHILEALRQTGNNKSRAAQLLNIDRKTLYNKLKLYGIEL